MALRDAETQQQRIQLIKHNGKSEGPFPRTDHRSCSREQKIPQVIPGHQQQVQRPSKKPQKALALQSVLFSSPDHHPKYQGTCPSCLKSFETIMALRLEEQERHVQMCFFG